MTEKEWLDKERELRARRWRNLTTLARENRFEEAGIRDLQSLRKLLSNWEVSIYQEIGDCPEGDDDDV